MKLKNILKRVLPIIAGPMIGPLVQSGIGSVLGTKAAEGLLGKLLTSAGTSGLISKLTGSSNKEAMENALISGIGSTILGGSFDSGGSGGESGTSQQTDSTITSVEAKDASKNIAATGSDAATDTGIGSFLSGPGLFGGGKMGELALFTMLPMLFGGDEEEAPPDQGPFGGTEELIPMINPDSMIKRTKDVYGFNTGGIANFPRRDGAIMPYEGGGRVDDVPAMLTAGEFVLTKDAVKGLGGGNQNVGIQRAYNMMNQLEGMA